MYLECNPEFTQNLLIIYPEFTQNSPKIYSEFTQNFAWLYPEFTQNLPRIYSEFIQNSPRIPIMFCLLSRLDHCVLRQILGQMQFYRKHFCRRAREFYCLHIRMRDFALVYYLPNYAVVSDSNAPVKDYLGSARNQKIIADGEWVM